MKSNYDKLRTSDADFVEFHTRLKKTANYFVACETANQIHAVNLCVADAFVAGRESAISQEEKSVHPQVLRDQLDAANKQVVGLEILNLEMLEALKDIAATYLVRVGQTSPMQTRVEGSISRAEQGGGK